MNTSSNTYTVIYAAVMVVLVAVILSLTALGLKDKQDANVRVEKMSDILLSVGKGEDADKVKDKNTYVEEQYAKYITNSYTVNTEGDVVEGQDAFAIALNMKAEYDKPENERNLPIFEAKMDDGTIYYVIPVYGSGLWGPVWGNVALKGDFNTIYGVSFGHQGETPGLGAEIASAAFMNQFKDKTIYSGETMVSIAMLKGAGSSVGNPNAVDAVSGGTITSRGVESMLKDNLSGYAAYFNKMRSGSIPASKIVPAEEIPNAEPVNDSNNE